MTGYVIAYAPCWGCRTPFSFNPNKVPSLPVKGVREPICRSCVELINAKRATLELNPFEIPPDAYEAIPEDEL